MLFKIDLWNPRQTTEEADISKLLHHAATNLYTKVKSADTTSHQDMVGVDTFSSFYLGNLGNCFCNISQILK